jgi:hypothetical protein
VVRIRDNATYPSESATVGQTLNNFIFKQSEYAYAFLSASHKLGKSTTKDELPETFRKCLVSYDAVIVFLKKESVTSPHTVFAQ